MFFIAGVVVSCVSITWAFIHAGGNMGALWQPGEVVIIVGVGIGSVLISSHKHNIKYTLKALKNLFKLLPYKKDDYSELLLFFFNATRIMKIKGLVAIEGHIENPEDSELFKLAPVLLKNPVAVEFIKNNLRLVIMGVNQAHQMEDTMDNEIAAEHDVYQAPSKLLEKFSDALPAIGIVAAVLGVIVTMKSIAEPPAVLGGLIGAALVGTFLGVLLCYALVGPMASFLGKYGDYQEKFLECMKIGILAYLQDTPPVVIIEFMRKSVPSSFRPSFHEIEVLVQANTMKVT